MKVDFKVSIGLIKMSRVFSLFPSTNWGKPITSIQLFKIATHVDGHIKTLHSINLTSRNNSVKLKMSLYITRQLTCYVT